MRDVVGSLTIVELPWDILKLALEVRLIKGFGDAVQFHSARRRADVLVTRDMEDFRKVHNDIKVMTPERFLRKYPI